MIRRKAARDRLFTFWFARTPLLTAPQYPVPAGKATDPANDGSVAASAVFDSVRHFLHLCWITSILPLLLEFVRSESLSPERLPMVAVAFQNARRPRTENDC